MGWDWGLVVECLLGMCKVLVLFLVLWKKIIFLVGVIDSKEYLMKGLL